MGLLRALQIKAEMDSTKDVGAMLAVSRSGDFATITDLLDAGLIRVQCKPPRITERVEPDILNSDMLMWVRLI